MIVTVKLPYPVVFIIPSYQIRLQAQVQCDVLSSNWVGIQGSTILRTVAITVCQSLFGCDIFQCEPQHVNDKFAWYYGHINDIHKNVGHNDAVMMSDI